MKKKKVAKTKGMVAKFLNFADDIHTILGPSNLLWISSFIRTKVYLMKYIQKLNAESMALATKSSLEPME